MKRIKVTLTIIMLVISLVNAQRAKSFQDFIVEKLNQTSFSKEGEKLARQAAANFRDLVNCDQFENVYSSNSIQQTFSINRNNLPYNLRSISWDGSDKPIRKNAFGKFSSDDFRTYNSLLAVWLDEYLSLYPVQKQIIYVQAHELATLEAYASATYFNRNEHLFWAKLKEMSTIEQRRYTILKYLKSHVDGYLNDYNNRNLDDTFDKIPEALELQKALSTNNWGLIEDAFNRFGYTLNKYLYPNQ